MNLSWRSEKGHLICRWSGAGEHAPYSPEWMQVTANVNPMIPAPTFLDFTRVSPFGGLRSYDPIAAVQIIGMRHSDTRC